MNAAPSAPIESASAAAWPRVKLGEVCELSLGKMLDASKNHGNLHPYLRNVNVRWCGFDLTDLRQMRAEPRDLPRYSAFPGDLIMCEGGEPGRCAIWRGESPILLQKALHRVRPGEQVLAEYLMHLFALYAQNGTFAERFSGTTIKHLTGEALAKIEIPLPPLPVQREIVSRLDTELAKADRMREGFLAIAENAAARFRAILAETFEGGEAGDSWPRKKLGDVCEVVLGGTPKTGNSAYWGGGIPWLTPGEMGTLASRYVERTNRTLTKAGLAAGSRLFPARSVILSTRAPIGYVFINMVPMCTNQGCKTLVPKPELLSEFLYFNLLGRTEELNALGTGTTFKELSTGKLQALEIPLPPLSVQREIVARLDAARAECDRAEALARKGAEECAGLRAALLKEAFE